MMTPTAPPPHAGKLYKKVPSALAVTYQDRDFELREARLAWRSGKGAQRTVQLTAGSRVRVLDEDTNEFAVSGVTTRIEETSASVVRDRIFRFRVETKAEMWAWVKAFEAHIRHEQDCLAAKSQPAERPTGEWEPAAAGVAAPALAMMRWKAIMT